MATYYVTTAGSSTNSGTISNPWSIKHAFATAQAGDTVYIKKGDYTTWNNNTTDFTELTTSRSGTSSNPIRFIGYDTTPGDITITPNANDRQTWSTYSLEDYRNNGQEIPVDTMPYFDTGSINPGYIAPDWEDGQTTNKWRGPGAIQINHSYIEIENIIVKRYYVGFNIQADNVTLKNVYSQNLGIWDPSHPCWNSGNGCWGVYPGGGDDGYGIVAGTLGSISPDNLTLESCVVIDAGAVSYFIIDCVDATIQYCTGVAQNSGNGSDYIFDLFRSTGTNVLDCYAERSYSNIATGGHASRALITQHGDDNNFERFYAVNCRLQVENSRNNTFKDWTIQTIHNGENDGGIQLYYQSNDNLFENFKLIGGQGIMFLGLNDAGDGLNRFPITSAGDNNYFINFEVRDYPIAYNSISVFNFHRMNTNTGTTAGTNYFLNFTVDDFQWLINANRTGTIYVYNSTFSGGNATTEATAYPNWDPQQPYNAYFYNCNDYNNNQPPISGTNMLTVNPNFVDITNRDLHLTENSSLIGAGMDASTIHPRAAYDMDGNLRTYPYDIGAYEYQEPANVYFVTTSGSSANDGKTEATAWSLKHAFATASKGDTVYIKAGNYIGSAGNQLMVSTYGASNGTATEPIRFIGYTSNWAANGGLGDIVADGGPTYKIDDWRNQGDDFDESTYPVLRWFSEPGEGGYNIPPSNTDGINIWTSYVELHNIQVRGFSVNVKISASHVTLNNVHSGRAGSWDPSHPDWGKAFSVDPLWNRGYNFQFIMSRGCTHATVKNCMSIDAAMDAYLVSGASIVESPYTVDTYHLFEDSYAYYENDGNGTDYMFNFIQSNHNIIRRCKAFRLEPTITGHGSRGLVIKYGSHDNLVEDFESYGCKNQLHSEAHDNHYKNIKMRGQLSDFQIIHANDNIIENLDIDYEGGVSTSGPIAFLGWIGFEYGYGCVKKGPGTGNIFINPVLRNGNTAALDADRQGFDPEWPAMGTNYIIGGTIDNFPKAFNANRGGTFEIYNTVFSNIDGYEGYSTGTYTNCRGTATLQNFSSSLIRNFHNCFFDNSNGFTKPAGTLSGNAQFKNTASGDYTLLGSSPLIGAGMDVSNLFPEAAYDIEGNLRVTYDIGAFAYDSNTPVIPITDLVFEDTGTREIHIDEGITNPSFTLKPITTATGDTYTYSITGVGNDPTLFTIVGDQLVLNNGGTFTPDYENPIDSNANNLYACEVKVTSSNGATFTKDMIVYIDDVTETINNDVPFYTAEAKAEMKKRFQNGYVTGTGFKDDITRCLDSVAEFQQDPSLYRPILGNGGGSGTYDERQTMFHSALYAYIMDDVALANMVMTELLATVNTNDLSASWWFEHTWLPTIDFSTQYSGWYMSARMRLYFNSYRMLENLQTVLTAAEKTQIETWFSDYAGLLKLYVDAWFNNYWGADWEINGLSKFWGENLYPETSYSTPYPIHLDAAGNINYDYVMTGAQNHFNNRIVESIAYLHTWSIHNNDLTYEHICREWFKNLIKYGLFSDGTFWELVRNKNVYNLNELGVWYSFATLNVIVMMAHEDAMEGHFQDDLLYDYETTDGIVNGSTELWSSGYLGSSTTDGVTPKSLKTFIIGQTNYYRSAANGGWGDIRYYGGLPMDMTGQEERDYSISQAIANLYYKDTALYQSYIYDQSVGYPQKNGYNEGSYFAGSDGNIGGVFLGAMWFEQEDNFFLERVTSVTEDAHIYTLEAKEELKNRFDNGFVAGTGFENDIPGAEELIASFLANPSQYRPTFGGNLNMPVEGQDIHLASVKAYAYDDVSIANVIADEILATVNQNDLNTAWWEASNTYRWDLDYAMYVQTTKVKRLKDSYSLIKGIQTSLTNAEQTQIHAWFTLYGERAYNAMHARLETYLGTDWQYNGISKFNGDPYPILPGGERGSDVIWDSSGNLVYHMALGQDHFNNRNWDMISYVHAIAIENGDIEKERWAREFVKTSLKYGLYPDGTWWEMIRNKDEVPYLGVWYGNISLGAIVKMAHLDAMSGHFPNDLLYDYETTEGHTEGEMVFNGYTTTAYSGTSTTDGVTPKSILSFIKGQSNYYRPESSGGWNDIRFYKHSTTDVLTALNPSGYTQPSVTAATANLYYKDQDIKDFYLYDTAVGYPGKVRTNQGYLAPIYQANDDYGPWGTYLLGDMWIGQEENFFIPYETQQDTSVPIITLNGPSIINLTLGETYTEYGAVWTDDNDGTGFAEINSNIDINTLGTYIVIYTYVNQLGISAEEVRRTVNVIDISNYVIPNVVQISDSKSNIVYLGNNKINLN